MRRSATASAQKSRKYLAQDVLHSLPVPSEKQIICRIVRVQGGNLIECEAPSQALESTDPPEQRGTDEIGVKAASACGDELAVLSPECKQLEVVICRLPTKLKSLVFFRPGLYLIASPESLAGDKGKVKYVVESILLDEQIKNLRTLKRWPPEFTSSDFGHGSAAVELAGAASLEPPVQVDEEDDDQSIFQNHNRRRRDIRNDTDSDED